MRALQPVLPYLIYAGVASQAILAGVIFAKRIWQRFPVFAAYSGANLLASACLFLVRAIDGTGYAYFYTYWIGEGAGVLLGFGVLYELFQDLLTSHSALKRAATMLFKWVLVFLLVLASAVIYAQSSQKQSPLVTAVIIMEQGVRVIEVGLIMFLFLFSKAFGLHWRQHVFGIALGLGIFACVELAGLSTFAHLGSVALGAFAIVRVSAFNLSLLIWIGYILAPEPVTTGELPKREQLEQWNRAVMEFMHQ